MRSKELVQEFNATVNLYLSVACRGTYSESRIVKSTNLKENAG